ncbi:hypothetical protein [Mycobacteroides abscessus]|uniref:hypothetical protein n=1 Tax=Mycobacteroides abscessus TaxID=36809 RepID=UPI001F2FFCA7|nr:hypothetical protein [Mycobacteroides abscessus]
MILNDVDEAIIAPYLDENSDAFEILRQWAELHGQAGIKSEAAALRVLLHAGAEELRNHALESGYAQLAQEVNAESAHAECRAARARYAERTD